MSHSETIARVARRRRAGTGPEAAGSAALLRAAQQLLLVVLPLAVTAFEFSLVLTKHRFALDFRGWYWLAGHRVLDGLSPYTLPNLQALKYPAPAALLFVPFGLLSNAAAGWVFAALVVAAIPGTLLLLGVRDWRIYAVTLLWQPVIVGWETANLSLLLTLGTAAAWRWRSRPALTGLVIAALISLKIFLLPLLIWLAITKRWRACAWAVAGSIAINLIAWLIVGFGQIPVYIQVLHHFQPGAERRGYSLVSLALHLGLSGPAAYAIGLAAAAAVVAAGLAVRSPARDRVRLTACIVASLLASPLVESHYLTLLLVPLALARPRLSALWALPIVLLLTPGDHPSNWQHALGVIVCLVVAAGACTGTWRRPPLADYGRDPDLAALRT